MSRSGLVTVLAAATLVLSACGATKPQPVVAMQPDAPADLCASVPEAVKTGLETSADTDVNGDPTAACSLSSAPGVKPEVRGVVTWLQLDDDDVADGVLASQCRAIDTAVYEVQAGYAPQGSDKACGGSGKLGEADAATVAAVAGRTVVTVRWSAAPAQTPAAFPRSTEVLESVLKSLTSGTASTDGTGTDS
jgi:hypothetical protein